MGTSYQSLPRAYNLTPANVNSSGYASGVSGATWALTANVPGDGLAHQVTIANQTANSHTGQTITIVGIDQNGQAAQETITGPAGNATVTSTKYYGTLTSVTPSATFGADTVNIGWNNVIAYQTINVNYMAEDILTLLATVTGTINFTINQTFDKIDFTGTPAITPTWLAIASSQTSGGTFYQTTGGATAIQIIVNSYSSGATLKVNANATFVPLAGGGSAGPAANVNLSQVGGTSVVTGGVNGLLAVAGNAASGAADSGNPVKVGGRYNSTPPTLTNGQRGDLQLDPSGNLKVSQAMPYAAAQTALVAASGNKANTTGTATLTGTASTTVYISGFECTASGATAGLPVSVTVTGVLGGTLTYTFTYPAGVLVPATPLIIPFNPPLPASAVNTPIVVTLPASGSGGTNAAVVAHGFYQ